MSSNAPHIRIGTRGSDLALWQAHHVRDLLQARGATVEIVVLKTRGDQIQNVSFDKMEGKGFFTKEIEQALLDGDVDLAVHSHKDLETTPPSGLVVAAVPPRGPVEDVVLVRPESVDLTTPFHVQRGGVVGTSSMRRKNQLELGQPDLRIKALRGNVPTRIQKLRDGQYDAIMLAHAGVHRLELDLTDLHVHVLDPLSFVPAPAQGALALQMREGDPLLPFVEALTTQTPSTPSGWSGASFGNWKADVSCRLAHTCLVAPATSTLTSAKPAALCGRPGWTWLSRTRQRVLSCVS